MQVTNYDDIRRGANELLRVYRGDHIIVWEPGDWYVEEVTGGTLETGVTYLFGGVSYDQNNVAHQWTVYDSGNGRLSVVDYCLPTSGIERKLSKAEYEYYFGPDAYYNVQFIIENGKFRLSGTSQYLSLGTQQSTPDLVRGVCLDSTGKPYLFGAETGQDLRLVDNGIEFAWIGSAMVGARRYPPPTCDDYSTYRTVYRLVRHR